MSTHSANIDRLRIATPCPISWEQMTGDGRVRFCGHCDKLTDLNMILELHGEALIGVVALPALFDTTPGTTIISGDVIRKLPIQ